MLIICRYAARSLFLSEVGLEPMPWGGQNSKKLFCVPFPTIVAFFAHEWYWYSSRGTEIDTEIFRYFFTASKSRGPRIIGPVDRFKEPGWVGASQNDNR